MGGALGRACLPGGLLQESGRCVSLLTDLQTSLFIITGTLCTKALQPLCRPSPEERPLHPLIGFMQYFQELSLACQTKVRIPFLDHWGCLVHWNAPACLVAFHQEGGRCLSRVQTRARVRLSRMWHLNNECWSTEHTPRVGRDVFPASETRRLN